jgi:hypothetical protein
MSLKEKQVMSQTAFVFPDIKTELQITGGFFNE